MLRKGFSTPARDMMPVFAVSIEHTVKVDVAIVKLFNDKKIILIDPARIAWFEALDARHCSVHVLFSIHWQ